MSAKFHPQVVASAPLIVTTPVPQTVVQPLLQPVSSIYPSMQQQPQWVTPEHSAIPQTQEPTTVQHQWITPEHSMMGSHSYHHDFNNLNSGITTTTLKPTHQVVNKSVISRPRIATGTASEFAESNLVSFLPTAEDSEEKPPQMLNRVLRALIGGADIEEVKAIVELGNDLNLVGQELEEFGSLPHFCLYMGIDDRITVAILSHPWFRQVNRLCPMTGGTLLHMAAAFKNKTVAYAVLERFDFTQLVTRDFAGREAKDYCRSHCRLGRKIKHAIVNHPMYGDLKNAEAILKAKRLQQKQLQTIEEEKPGPLDHIKSDIFLKAVSFEDELGSLGHDDHSTPRRSREFSSLKLPETASHLKFKVDPRLVSSSGSESEDAKVEKLPKNEEDMQRVVREAESLREHLSKNKKNKTTILSRMSGMMKKKNTSGLSSALISELSAHEESIGSLSSGWSNLASYDLDMLRNATDDELLYILQRGLISGPRNPASRDCTSYDSSMCRAYGLSPRASSRRPGSNYSRFQEDADSEVGSTTEELLRYLKESENSKLVASRMGSSYISTPKRIPKIDSYII